MKIKLLYFIVLIISAPLFINAQLISEPISFYDNGKPMQIKYLNEDLKLVKYIFKDSDGKNVSEFNYDPETGVKNGSFFSGENKGNYNMGVLSADNYTIIHGSQKFVIDKIKDGRISGNMHCYTRKEIYGSAYDNNTSQLLSHANKQRINFYQSYGTGKFNEEFKCTLHYNDNGDLDGEQWLNGEYKLYFKDGKLTGYIRKNPGTAIARDSIFRENKLWKYNNQFLKNCGYAWLKDFDEFDEPWAYNIEITYMKGYNPHFFGSTKIKPTRGPNFYPSKWMRSVREDLKDNEMYYSNDFGVRAEKRTLLNEYGIYIYNNQYSIYDSGWHNVFLDDYDMELSETDDLNKINLFNQYNVLPKKITDDHTLNRLQRDKLKVYPDLRKISSHLKSDTINLTEYFYKDTSGNYINPIVKHKELVDYLNSEIYDNLLALEAKYQDTLDNFFALAFSEYQNYESSKLALDKYFEVYNRGVNQSLNLNDRFLNPRFRPGSDYSNSIAQYGDAFEGQLRYKCKYVKSTKEKAELILSFVPNNTFINSEYVVSWYWKRFYNRYIYLNAYLNGTININDEEVLQIPDQNRINEILAEAAAAKARAEAAAQLIINEANKQYKNKEYVNALSSYEEACQLAPSICNSQLKSRIDSLTDVDWKFSYDWQSYQSFINQINSTHVPQINIDSIGNFSGGIYNYFSNLSEGKKGFQVFFKPIASQKNALPRGDSQRCLNEYKKLIDYLAPFSFLNIKASTLNHFGVILDIEFVEKPKIEFLNYDLKELKEMYKSKKTYFIYFDFDSMNSFFILNTNKEQIYNIQKEDLSNPSSTNESLRPINL